MPKTPTDHYRSELSRATEVIAETLATLNPGELREIASVLAGMPVLFVASGGAYAAALLAALAHTGSTGLPAQAVTPLEMALAPSVQESVVVLLSATARHPDTAMAASSALRRGLPLVLITQRKRSELAGVLSDPRLRVLTIPQVGGRDGFLATNSLVGTCVAIAALYGIDLQEFEALSGGVELTPLMHQSLLVLHGPLGNAAAADVESRFAESGLADIQICDYRSFAHGRHFGIDRRRAAYRILALVDPQTQDLARRTLACVPDDVPRLEISTSRSGVQGAIDLVLKVLALPIPSSDALGVRLDKPGVPEWGRGLYHLRWSNLNPSIRSRAPGVQRKVNALGSIPASAEEPLASIYSAALERWRLKINKVSFSGVVLDYDGTVVATNARREPPIAEVRRFILGLLEAHVAVGFASGRGDSLYHGLRTWIPPHLWAGVHLALHNGTWRIKLSDVLNQGLRNDPAIEGLRQQLDPICGIADIRVSGEQLSVRPHEAFFPIPTLRAIVADLVRGVPTCTPLRVVESGHSVDVIGGSASKADLALELGEHVGNVLVIGDSGNESGNDRALLESTEWSISVGRVGTSRDRGWNLAPLGCQGPPALLHHLDWLSIGDGWARLRIPRAAVAERRRR